MICFDLFGFGFIGFRKDNNYIKEVYVCFVMLVFDVKGVDCFVLVGNLLGGNIVWMIVVDFLEWV